MADSLAQQVDRYLKNNPETTNSDLYKKFPKMRKNTLRYYKSKFIKDSNSAPKKNVKKNTKAKATPAKVAKVKTNTNTKTGTTKSKTIKSKTTGKKSKPANSKKVLTFLTANPTATYDQLFAEFPTETKVSLRAIKQKFKKKKKVIRNKRSTPPVEVSRKEKEALATTGRRLSKIGQVTTVLSDATKKIQNPLVKSISSGKPGVKKIKMIEEQLLKFAQDKKKAKIEGQLSKFGELQCMVTEKIAGIISAFRNKKER